MRITAPLSITCMLMTSILITTGCRKEKTPEPSNRDINYFVVNDNPNDPIDHAIYEFYKSTGIPGFYTDTIYKKKVSRENEHPERFAYVTLSLSYSPLGDGYLDYVPLSSRKHIPGLLNLLQTEVIPKLPPVRLFPCILFVDSFTNYFISDIQISHGWCSLPGFNALGMIVKDVEAMSAADKKMYAASIMAGIAEKRINDLMATRVQKEFLSISREVSKSQNLFPFELDIYFGWPFLLIIPSVPPPQDLGFLFYPTFDMGGTKTPNMLRETDDIRGFLTAIFYYTDEEFAALHTNETLVLKKFSIMRNMAKEAGFKLPG